MGNRGQDQGDPLARIADALERLAPASSTNTDWLGYAAYVWNAGRIATVDQLEALPLDRIKGIDRQKHAVCENVRRHALGRAAHDMLLWGARGMGKSAVLRAAVASQQAEDPSRLALVELDPGNLAALPELFATLELIERRFILFLDDLAFNHSADQVMRHLRSALEGSLVPRPANVRLAVTSNHRAIVARTGDDQPGPLQERDAMDDSLALADRFGLRLGFHPCSQQDYLAIAKAHADPLGLEVNESEALGWSRARGPLSGRSAWQFVVELAGRAGTSL